MTLFIRLFSRSNRLVTLGVMGIFFAFVFKFQMALYMAASTGRMISGFDVISIYSWKIFAWAVSIYFLVISFGLVIFKNKNLSTFYGTLEHRIFYAVLFFSMVCAGAFSRTYFFHLDPLSPVELAGAIMASLLLSLTIRMKRSDGEWSD